MTLTRTSARQPPGPWDESVPTRKRTSARKTILPSTFAGNGQSGLWLVSDSFWLWFRAEAFAEAHRPGRERMDPASLRSRRADPTWASLTIRKIVSVGNSKVLLNSDADCLAMGAGFGKIGVGLVTSPRGPQEVGAPLDPLVGSSMS
jgi:hypothetical protein